MGRPRQRFCPKGHDKDETGRKRDGWCRRCYETSGREAMARYRRSEKGQNALLLRRYGITLDDYNALFAAQGGSCAVCGLPFQKTPHIDHDHASGRVRGLLHPRCNALVAHAESPLLASAQAYLKRRPA